MVSQPNDLGWLVVSSDSIVLILDHTFLLLTISLSWVKIKLYTEEEEEKSKDQPVQQI